METHELHRGRLIDHIQLVVKDLALSNRFYTAALSALGISTAGEGKTTSGRMNYSSPVKTVVRHRGQPPDACLAFRATNREAVERFYSAALAAGDRENGKPGERPYHRGYYAAFVTDPDGNNIEAMYQGPAQKSADSVKITFT